MVQDFAVSGGTPQRELAGRLEQDLRRAADLWWVLLVLGTAWIVVAVVVLQFSYASVTAISVLFGILALAVGLSEAVVGRLTAGAWRFVHLLAAVVLAATGVVGFVRPGDTFTGLAAVVGFFLVFRGTADLVSAFATPSSFSGRWVFALTGTAELLLGFWAAGSWGLSAAVLVSWVGAMALLHGVTEIGYAFRLRQLR